MVVLNYLGFGTWRDFLVTLLLFCLFLQSGAFLLALVHQIDGMLHLYIFFALDCIAAEPHDRADANKRADCPIAGLQYISCIIDFQCLSYSTLGQERREAIRRR